MDAPIKCELTAHLFDEPKEPKPIILAIPSCSGWPTVSFTISIRAFSFSAFFAAFFSSRSASSLAFTSASLLLKSKSLALDASFVFSLSRAMRARTCATVDRAMRVVCPSRLRSARHNENSSMGKVCWGLTLPAVYMIKVACGISVCAIACFTKEARLSWTSAAWVLDNDGFIQVLAQLKVMFALLHEFSGFG